VVRREVRRGRRGRQRRRRHRRLLLDRGCPRVRVEA
jgi:hypothetical protein